MGITNERAKGFESQLAEVDEPSLRVEGDVPEWLQGRLLRTGPARWELERDRYRHWFDGLAMLTEVELRGGQGAAFRNRFLRSHAYREATRNGRIVVAEFGSEPPRGPLAKLIAALRMPGITDNGNVNVARFGEEFVAMTETPFRTRIDPATLETLGPFEYEDELEGMLTTAHPHIDAGRGRVYNHLTEFGPRSHYHLYGMPIGSHERKRVASLQAPEPAYIHSLGATEDYLVLVEGPFLAHPLRMRFDPAPYRERYRWKPDRGTRIRVVHKDTGEVVADRRADPIFTFHHVNAFEEDGAIVADVVAHDDTSIVDEFSLAHLRSSNAASGAGWLRRYVIRPGSDGHLEQRDLSHEAIEFPRIDPRREQMRHRYVYGAANHAKGFYDTLVRIDVEDGSVQSWHEPGTYPGEPVFVPAPGSDPDQGVCLSIVLDAANDRSFLLILDAETMEPRARIETPVRIPFHFHGQFFAAA